MAAYTTAQLDSIVVGLEAGLAVGYAEVVAQDGRRLTYRSVDDIRKAITYFQSLYDNASDAPPVQSPKVRTFFLHGNKGFGQGRF
jgi:hypothetical protein